MKYFTKEYIKECDCREIQGLRKKFQEGDWYFNVKFPTYKPSTVDMEEGGTVFQNRWRKNVIWLPKDQLDEEIVKICKERFRNDDFTYYFNYNNNVLPDVVYFTAGLVHKGDICLNSNNPLIAKIKLLKQLLKESEE
jgi:hypothetical protein